ncbi:uncharacterized protein LOC132605922 [Lycium barbarum]|uniref:uncharacterized protein LOC132605922 n=1 Tax=Lycium barbarum TaxID=112863 RepID=UPI00293EBDAB|nr:uncharacterized protein LOC132605922 [Lycium barbarum]
MANFYLYFGRKYISEGAEEDNNLDCCTENYNLYLPLYRASLSGNWKEAKPFFSGENKASRVVLNSFLQTSLHVAVGSKNDNAKHFVETLVESMPDNPLDMKDHYGDTPLHYAARFGNLDAAKILVARNMHLPNIVSNGLYPIHEAADYAYISADVYIYLLGVTTVRDPFNGSSGIRLLRRLLHSNKCGLATELVEQYPDLAKHDPHQGSALAELATKEFSLLRGHSLSIWQRLLFYCVPIRSTSRGQKRIPIDIENVTDEPQMFKPKNCWLSPICERIYFSALIKKLGGLSFDVLERLVPSLKLIRDKKSEYYNAVTLVECLCKKIESLSCEEVATIASGPLLEAAKYDNYELVEAIVRKFPSLVYYNDGNEKNIFHIAIENRCENVFNLVYQMSQHRHSLMILADSSRNTMLHFAGQLAPPNKLNLVPGPALQMQRELQWFKEVKNLVPPFHREFCNNDNNTPSEVFTKEHAELKIKGEEWMKGTSNSCTIAAALIATIAFAAAITVPGGNDGESGLPIFARNNAFIVFAISNAASLFTSSTSLLVFLSVLTSRYAEEDFLYALPRSLILGLLALFLSITLMTVSFSATVYIVFGQKKTYVLVPVVVMACLPIISFVLLQFPLIVALISSNLRGIFGKKSNRPFY